MTDANELRAVECPECKARPNQSCHFACSDPRRASREAAMKPDEEHPLARMTRLDEEMGLYDDDEAVPLSPNAVKPLGDDPEYMSQSEAVERAAARALSRDPTLGDDAGLDILRAKIREAERFDAVPTSEWCFALSEIRGFADRIEALTRERDAAIEAATVGPLTLAAHRCKAEKLEALLRRATDALASSPAVRSAVAVDMRSELRALAQDTTPVDAKKKG